MGDDRPAVYVEDGRVVYRASALGGCLISLAAARQGFETKPLSDKQLEIYDAGNTAEDQYFADHPAAGQQTVLELAVTAKIAVRAHADALEDTYGIEVKSQSADLWERWTPGWFQSDPLWAKYTWQISAMMLATGLPWQIVRVKRDDPTDIAVFTVEKPFWDLDQLRARVFEVEILAREPELKCTVADWLCAYPYLHTDDTETVEDPELDRTADQYLLARAEAEECSRRVSKLRDQVIGLLDGRQKIRLGSGTQVLVSQVEVKEHLVKASTQTRLTVRAPK